MSPQQREILVVDDEVGIRELLSEILQDEGYRVAVAENAHEARAYRSRMQPRDRSQEATSGDRPMHTPTGGSMYSPGYPAHPACAGQR